MINSLLIAAQRHRQEFQSLLRALVEIESPSHDKAAVDRAVTFAAAEFKKLGGKVRRHKQRNSGDILQVDFPGADKKSPLLLLGHLDTVWEIGTLQSMP